MGPGHLRFKNHPDESEVQFQGRTSADTSIFLSLPGHFYLFQASQAEKHGEYLPELKCWLCHPQLRDRD